MEEKQDKVRLLLVDDEVEFLESTTKALSRRGFEVFRSPNADVALKLMEREQFDVAVLDVKMPGMQGDDLFREIKRLRPAMAVIILTGHGTVEQAFQTSREGVFDYLTKPCDMDKLAETARGAVEAHRRAADCIPEANGEEIRLLVVDDEEELLDSLFMTLTRRGMKVATAQGGVEALQWLEQRNFEVVVLDIKMPGIDGISLLSLIKDSYPLTEVILLTGHPSVETAVDGIKEGAFDYVTKPQDVDMLEEKIRQASARCRARTEKARRGKIHEILKRHPE